MKYLEKITNKINKKLYEWNTFDLIYYIDMSKDILNSDHSNKEELFLESTQKALRAGRKVLELGDKLKISTKNAQIGLSLVETLHDEMNKKIKNRPRIYNVKWT